MDELDTALFAEPELPLPPSPLRRYRRSGRSRRPGSEFRGHRSRSNRARARELRRRSRGDHKRKRGRAGGVRRRGGGGGGGGAVVKAQVELLVVVENSIYRSFLASNFNNPKAALARLRRYYGIVVAMMDQRFQTIDDRRLSISVSISGFAIAETRADSGWLEKLVDWSGQVANGRASVNTDQALLDFGKWVKFHLKDLPKFDHAMLFSGYRLTNKYGVSFAGKAYLNAVCDGEHGNAVSIVSDRGDFQCVKVAAHELAHSLGSVHDGDPGFEDCPYDSNYVMARVASNKPDTLKNSFYFSRCSIKQMKKLLRSDKECVRDTPTVFYKYDLQRPPPGQIISPDQHCQLIYGAKSTFCNEEELKSKMCGQLWCRDPNENNACRTNSYLTALPGTVCSHDKTCHLGECLTQSQIQQKTARSQHRSSSRSRTRPSAPQRAPAPSSPSSSSSSSGGRRVVATPGSSQSRLTGGRLDNTIPTVPQSSIRGRVGRLSKERRLQLQREREQRRRHKARSGRRRTRPRNKSRRKGRCKANQPDKNVEYCRGIVRVNPSACKRHDIGVYCCRTCAFRR